MNGLINAYILDGKTNVGGKGPKALDAIAEDGAGVHRNTAPLWTSSFVDLTARVPLETKTGGIVFFDALLASPERTRGALELIDVDTVATDYVVYQRSSTDPMKEKYFTQWRFIGSRAVEFYFKTGKHTEVPPQKVTIGEAVSALITGERKKYLEEMNAVQYERLLGMVGEDGSFGLGFGFLVENAYYRIYRLWSRPIHFPK